jgi:hypothetical protein
LIKISVLPTPNEGIEMSDSDTAGGAALSICESLLISLQELKILNPDEARAVLEDAAATHRNGVALLTNADQHLAIAELIEGLIPILTTVPIPRT